jgi:hypothetical protein
MARRPPGSLPPRPGRSPADDATAPVWETLYQSASPTQRAEWLALAQRQGILYAHQLPPVNNGATTSDRCRHLLTLILAGRAAELEPVLVDGGPAIDAQLDPCQQTAVARALETPDFFLLQGVAGTGKSRTVAELVTLAAARGERVLLLAPTAAAIDRVLELASARGPFCGVRCLGREERPEAIPPVSRALTLAGHTRRLHEEALPAARREVEVREECCRRRRQDEAVLVRLQELAGQRHTLHQQMQALDRRREELARFEHELTAKPDPVRAEMQLRLDTSLAELEGKRNQHGQDLKGLDAEIAVVRPLAEARQSGRWWTATWWRTLFKPGLRGQLTELESRHKTAEAALAELDREAERLREEHRRAVEAHEAERLRTISEEVGQRRSQIDSEAACLQAQSDALEREVRERTAELDPATPHPADAGPEAVWQALEGWRRRLHADEEAVAFARDWVTCLEQTAGTLTERLPGYAQVVAATTAALPADALFGDRSPHGSGFDLLVLEEADHVTESEFVALARRARRWVLVGEPAWEPIAEAARPAARTPTVSFFHRLWQHLHCDPRRLPYTWAREGAGLCCRLWPVAPEQRPWLESERVVDFPDIELRILTLPETPPRLAEVHFPPSMSIAQAKEYIYRELQELPVRVSCPSLCWVEEPDRIVLQLADVPPPNPVPVALEGGIRELVGTRSPAGDGTAWETCCIEFDRHLGWQRRRAEEWAQEHLALRDLGRTGWLRTPHRMEGGLATFLSEVLFDGGYRVSAGPAKNPACTVEFVPVPAAPRQRPQSGARGSAGGNGAQRARSSARGGAGLELDLADARHRDRLPDELRPQLPASGLVNYLEAQAVVRAVETLVTGNGTSRPSVAVIALYAAQADLIRRLLSRTPAVASSGVSVEVGTPSEFRQRECPVVFLSLTRSHTHRAVAYGSDPRSFALALTRACRRLVLFGDPGTLLRRAQWQGPLEHLDETAAARERQLVEVLARYLQGQGRSPEIFQVREGGGP